MKMKRIWGLISILVICSAHPHGAPTKSCRSLLPHHKHIRYDVDAARLRVFAIDGNTLRVDLEADRPFKGFILQARDEEGEIRGTFQEGQDYKLMKCHHTYGNSITHFNSQKKHKIQAVWQNDAYQPLNDIIIKAVVVYDYKHAQKLELTHTLEFSVIQF